MITKHEIRWVTKNGYEAEVLLLTEPSFNNPKFARILTSQWRCGYVRVPETHPLYLHDYRDSHPCLSILINESTRIGSRGIIPIMMHAINPDPNKEVAIDLALDVHGSLTFSGSRNDGAWWFGFDCHHSDDTVEKCTLEYCIEQCEFLAAQLKDLEEWSENGQSSSHENTDDSV